MPINNEQPKRTVIYDSTYFVPYEEYKEWCEENAFEVGKENSQGHLSFADDVRSSWWEDVKDNMRYSNIDYPLAITGSLGLWDGRHEIVPVIVYSRGGKNKSAGGREYYDKPSIKIAVERIANGKGVGDFDIAYENGMIVMNCFHHDGTNTFEIRKLSKKGMERMGKALESDPFCELKREWFARIKENEIDF